MLDTPLIDIGQDRIGAAKGDKGCLGKEPAHLCERAFPAIGHEKQNHDSSPDKKPHQGEHDTPAPFESCMHGNRGVIINQRGTVGIFRIPMMPARPEFIGSEL